MQSNTDKILNLLAEDRLIRRKWSETDEQGRQLVCLLAALSPEVAEYHEPFFCPADVMPQWLAYLTPWMDDAGSQGAWKNMVRRYADLAGRWHVLTAEDWRRLDYSARRIALEMARPDAGTAVECVDAVLTLLRRAEIGAVVTEKEWNAAKAAAWAARAARAALASAEAAWAARAAAEAARAAWAAAAAAADKITSEILDAIEKMIVKREAM